MNTYELADKLAKITGYSVEHEHQHELIVEAVIKLRDQADKIAELEKQSQPVLWGKRHPISGELYEATSIKNASYCVPLYTAPQLKPLSRQDILDIYSQYKEGVPWLKFAREIESKILGLDGETGELKSAEVLK